MLHEKARAALWDCNPASYEITDKGLEIWVDTNTKKALKKLQRLEDKGEPVGFHTDELFLELIEHCLCNGLTVVQPEDIAALTSSIILSDTPYEDTGKFPADADVYWFPNYQVRSPIENLVQDGKVIFHKAS